MRLSSLLFWRKKPKSALPPLVTAIITHGMDARRRGVSPDTLFVTQAEADEITAWYRWLYRGEQPAWTKIASGSRIYGVVIGVR